MEPFVDLLLLGREALCGRGGRRGGRGGHRGAEEIEGAVLVEEIADREDEADREPEGSKHVSGRDEDDNKEHAAANPGILEELVLLGGEAEGKVAAAEVEKNHTEADQIGIRIQTVNQHL